MGLTYIRGLMPTNLSTFFPKSGTLDPGAVPNDPVGAVRAFAKGAPSTMYGGKYMKLTETRNVRLLKSAYPELFAFLGYRGVSQDHNEPSSPFNTFFSFVTRSVAPDNFFAMGGADPNSSSALVNTERTGVYVQGTSNGYLQIKRATDPEPVTISVTTAMLGVTYSSANRGIVSDDCTKFALCIGATFRLYTINANNTLTFLRSSASFGQEPYRYVFSNTGAYIIVRGYYLSNYKPYTINFTTGALTQSTGTDFPSGRDNFTYKYRLMHRVPGKDIYVISNYGEIRTYVLVGGVLQFKQAYPHYFELITPITKSGCFYCGSSAQKYALDTDTSTNVNLRAYAIDDNGVISKLDKTHNDFYRPIVGVDSANILEQNVAGNIWDMDLDTETGMLFMMLGGESVPNLSTLIWQTNIHIDPFGSSDVENTPILFQVVPHNHADGTYPNRRDVRLGVRKGDGTVPVYSLVSSQGREIIPNGQHISNCVILPSLKSTSRFTRYTNTSPFKTFEYLKTRDFIPVDYMIRVKP